jgi:putative hydrolase of the HAD superfamily
VKALILDFGGVLTSDFVESQRAFARAEGLSEEALLPDAEGAALLRDLERGAISQDDFETAMAAKLGIPRDGLLRRMVAHLEPNEEMLAFIAELRASGVKIGVLSNSLGAGYLDPYAPWGLAERADAIVISHEVRLRKPDPEIFDLIVERLGIPARDCLFVDDIAAYLEPARAKDMAVWHHTDTSATLVELRQVFHEDVYHPDFI